MKTLFGFCAKMPSTAPHVHFSGPGSEVMGFGQSGTTSYGPVMSCPPFSPGTATNPNPGFACAWTGASLLASTMPIATPTAIATTVSTTLRITFLLKISNQESRREFSMSAWIQNSYFAVILAQELTPAAISRQVSNPARRIGKLHEVKQEVHNFAGRCTWGMLSP